MNERGKMKEIEEVENILRQCVDCGLDGMEITEQFTLEELASIYNGIGPDRFPEVLRTALDKLNPSLLPVAFIHDIQYHVGGTKSDFTAANTLFKTNGKRMAFATYGWYDPRRYLVWNTARRFGNLCERFGLKGYNLKTEKVKC